MKKLILVLGCFTAMLSSVSCTTDDFIKSESLNENTTAVDAKEGSESTTDNVKEGSETILIYLGNGYKDTSHG